MKLFENWDQVKTSLTQDLPESKKAIVEQCLDNQMQHIVETAGPNAVAAGAVGNFQKIVIPMIRRIIPGTIATEVVGVQPMTGPVGLAYSLRFIYAQALNTGDSRTDIMAGDETFGNNSKTKRFYSGGATAGPDGTLGTADDVATGIAAVTQDFEAYGGRNIKLEVLKQTVTAGTRKLQAQWTTEAMTDLKNQHGLNLESEITTALSAEVVSEIDNEIITDLLQLAGTAEVFDMASTAFTGTPHYVGDRLAILGVLINKVANEIARKTRRGAGNFIIVSPLVVSALQSAAKSVFAPAVEGKFEGPNGTRLVGTLNGTIKVYSYLYHDQGTEPILVGYKGGNGQMDTGYFYCPYVPLQATPTVLHPETFNQHVSLSTRYGKAVFVNSGTSLANSADYYGKITIANLTFQ